MCIKLLFLFHAENFEEKKMKHIKINIRLVMVHQSYTSAHCSSMTDHDLTCCKEKRSHDY